MLQFIYVAYRALLKVYACFVSLNISACFHETCYKLTYARKK